MKSLRIGLGPETGSAAEARAAPAIILAKALAFDDYRSPYAGAGLSLLGACSDGARAEGLFHLEPGRSIDPLVLVGSDARDRNRRLMDVADRFASSLGGYGGLEDAFDILALARLDRFSDPLAFFAASEPRRRFGEFLARVERAGLLRPDQLSVSVLEREIPSIAGALRRQSASAFLPTCLL